eukprot:269675_1
MSSIFAHFTVFLALPALVIGSCSPAPAVCGNYSGMCSKPLLKFVLGTGKSAGTEASDVREDISNNLSYGRYCGASTRCIAENIAEGNPDNAPDGCNAIDEACKRHDSCLDGLKGEYKVDGPAKSNNVPQIPYPDRCPCEYEFVASLFMAKVLHSVSKGRLCDKAFYVQVQELLPGAEEEDIFATPYCFNIWREGDDGTCDPDLKVCACPETKDDIRGFVSSNPSEECKAVCYCNLIGEDVKDVIGGESNENPFPYSPPP